MSTTALGEWRTSDLAELIDAIESGQRPYGGATESSGEIPSLGGENIRQDGGLELSTLKRIPSDFYRGMTKGVLRRHDVLINKDGANTGKASIYDGEFSVATINEHLFLLRSKADKLAQRLLYRVLTSEHGKRTIRAKISGSAQPGLKSDFIHHFPVAVPHDLAEQGRIVEVLDMVDAAIAKSEAVVAKLKQVRAGLLHDLLTRGLDEHGQLRPPPTDAPRRYKSSLVGTIPRDWDAGTLDDLVSPERPIVYGILMPGRGFAGGVPVIKVKDIRDGQIDATGLLLTDPRIDAAYRRSRVLPGDLLFTIRGTVGRMAIVPMELADANITQDTARISLPDSNATFVARWLETEVPLRFVGVHTIGVAVRGINLRDVRRIPVPLVSRHEQDAIVERVTTHEQRTVCEQQCQSKLVQLKSGLMPDLLTGRVRVPESLGLVEART